MSVSIQSNITVIVDWAYDLNSRKCLISSCGDPNSKHWFTTFFLQPLPYLVTPQGQENCQLTRNSFVGAQTVVSLLQTTQIISDVCFITDHVAYASSNKTKIV